MLVSAEAVKYQQALDRLHSSSLAVGKDYQSLSVGKDYQTIPFPLVLLEHEGLLMLKCLLIGCLSVLIFSLLFGLVSYFGLWP